MGRQFLDVDHLEIRRRKHTLRREQSQIRIVLVIDGVVLVAFNQAEQVRNLDADPTRVGDQRTQPLAEVDDVGNVREYIVCDHQVGLAMPGRYITTGLLTEEHDFGVDAPVPSHVGNVGGRLDPERSDATSNAVLEQVAVVARHLNNEGLIAEP